MPTRQDAEAILLEAANQAYSNVTFSMETETSAVGTASDGTAQAQTIRTKQTGELDRSGGHPQMHMNYAAQSNMELGKITYEMFLNPENLIVRQGEQLYVDAMTEDALNSYANSVTEVISKDSITEMLDMAKGFKIDESNGKTIVTVTVDVDKLQGGQEGEAAEADGDDASADAAEADPADGADAAAADSTDDADSLPQGARIATMVASYCIGEDGRFEAVRLMSNTSGSPTYRVKQTYEFSDYDATTLPEWPDLDAYVAEQSGVMTDEDGRMYIVGDDGMKYYVSDIGDDGTIYYDTGAYTSGAYASGADDGSYYYYYDDPSSTTADAAADSTQDSSSAQGRAYITAEDGTVHYLDEEGSQILDTGDGRLFIDADGNYYFLSEE